MPERLTFDPTVLHRTEDPRTSVEAAHQAGGLQELHQNRILATLRQRDRLTSAEIAEASGLDYFAVARRMNELARALLVVDTGERRYNTSGRKATVWGLR